LRSHGVCMVSRELIYIKAEVFKLRSGENPTLFADTGSGRSDRLSSSL
jgi:hypothetical protein